MGERIEQSQPTIPIEEVKQVIASAPTSADMLRAMKDGTSDEVEARQEVASATIKSFFEQESINPQSELSLAYAKALEQKLWKEVPNQSENIPKILFALMMADTVENYNKTVGVLGFSENFHQRFIQHNWLVEFLEVFPGTRDEITSEIGKIIPGLPNNHLDTYLASPLKSVREDLPRQYAVELQNVALATMRSQLFDQGAK